MITVTDLFAGAGGSSTGMVAIPGVRIDMAANHWALAIETHNTNHPDVRHDCADISQVDPRRYPRTDVLWASPECTNHSQARGKKRDDNAGPDLFGDALPDEAADRSRATMWDVPRFAEHHRYRAVIVENVVDAYHWQPFKAWLMAMDSLGYDHQLVWLNSMHAQGAGMPAPQSRDRMYVVFIQRGERRPDVARWTRPRAWCPGCQQVVRAVQSFKRPDRAAWGRYRAQYVYRCPSVACRNQVVEPAWLPAAAALDWTLPGERIGDRAKPLAPKTMARIEAGLRKYARTDMLVPAGGTWNDTAQPVSVPMRTRTTRDTDALVAPPLLIPVEGRDGKQATTVDDPMRTMTTRNETGLMIPLRANNTAKLTTVPFDTFAANGNHHALVMRNNSSKGDGGEMCTPAEEPLRTITTKGHQSLVQWGHLLVDYNGPARTTADPLPTATTVQGDGVASLEVDVMDCLFRMLEPEEIARGMAFPDTYLMLGNKRERVKLAGNAVTPPAARDLIAAVVEALTGEAAA